MYCPSCGKEIDDESAFCRVCGAELDSESPSPQEAPNTEGEDGGSEVDIERDSYDVLKRIGYWGGRIIQLGAVFLAIILLLGGIAGNMNVLAFAVLGIVALVLLAGVGVVELLIIRPTR